LQVGRGFIAAKRKKAMKHTVKMGGNHCSHGKATSIAYSECMSVALVIQQAKRMRRIIKHSSVACLAVPCFSTLSHKRQDFREKVIEYETCVRIFSRTLSATHLILRRFQRNVTINLHRYSCKVPVILVRF